MAQNIQILRQAPQTGNSSTVFNAMQLKHGGPGPRARVSVQLSYKVTLSSKTSPMAPSPGHRAVKHPPHTQAWLAVISSSSNSSY